MANTSSNSPSADDVIAKIRKATIDKPGDASLPPARFVLTLLPNRDDAALAREIEQELASLGAKVTRLQRVDPTTLVLTLAYRTMKRDPAPVFDAGYAIADRYELENCEPDIETDYFAEPAPAKDGREGFDNFPPGCWVDPDAELKDKWRWAPENMRVFEAWAYSESKGRPSRGEGIVIAQPDTGVAAHEELDGVKQAPGYDFLDKDTVPTDPLNYDGQVGHGTATASVAVSPEAGRVFGTAPRATHMPLRAIETVVRVSQVRVAEAVNFAVDRGAHVITMSLGGLPSNSLSKAIKRAVKADVIVLAAAGNCVGLVVWPARYDICVAVAGSTSKDTPWKGTCKGSDVDISAPGENVYRAKVVEGQIGKGTEVVQGQGTSFSVALTAGVAALWLAHHGRANLIASARARGETLQAMFVRLLRASSRRPVPWDTGEMGAGIVDALELLSSDFDRGRDRETALPVNETDADALTVRRLVTEAISPEAADAPISWERHGPEIAAAILDLKRRSAPTADRKLRREAVEERPPNLSPTLREAAKGTALESALGIGDAP